mgnify:CR=1 FL=1|jgi:hypothetical protein
MEELRASRGAEAAAVLAAESRAAEESERRGMLGCGLRLLAGGE